MSKKAFDSDREAKEFLVAKIVVEAKREGVSLSEVWKPVPWCAQLASQPQMKLPRPFTRVIWITLYGVPSEV
jgi:hypothetical protein